MAMNQRTPAQMLIEGRAVIADPSHWTQGKDARDSHGNAVDVFSASAVCWCSIGALRRVFNQSETFTIYDALEFLSLAAGTDSVTGFNDRHTHAEVIDLWDRAIAAAERDV